MMSTNKKSEKSQHERFKEAAREHGADESEEAFDATLRKIVKKPPPPPDPEKGSKGDS